MKRSLCAVVAVCMAVSLVGCDAVQRKFTRKPKKVKTPHIPQEQKYIKKPTPELYEKHFAYWQSWSSEILQDLGDNRKKDRQCMEQLISQLNDMKNILIPEKGDELAKHIRRYEEVRDIVVREELSQYNMSFARTTLDREDRIIKNEFNISKVKNYLKKSFEDQAAPASAAASVPAPVLTPVTPAPSMVSSAATASDSSDEQVPADRVVQEATK